MNRLYAIATISLATLPLLLGGCSSVHIQSSPPPMASNDIPPASSLDTKHTQTLYLAIMNGLRDQGQARAALAYLDEFDKIYPGDSYAALLRAQCLMDVGKIKQAEPVFILLLQTRYAAAANAGLGSIAAAHNDWDHAVASFREASRLEPSHAQYANDLGFSQVRLGDYDGGIDMLGRASELAPSDRFIRNNLILALHLSGKDDDANRLIEEIPDSTERLGAKKLLLVSAKTLVSQTALHSQGEALPPPPAQTAAADDNKLAVAKPAGKETKL
jgi:Flp pilus assembly protein TadD